MARHRGGPARATYFPAGTPIEVRTADPGLNGAWHQATVTRARPRRTNYEVDYAVVGLALPRTVPANLVRPRPPPAPAGASVNDLVEAFCKDGWWIGVVSAVGHGGERYTVTFPGSRESAEFGRSEIRPYREWRRGRWFALVNQVEAMFSEGTKVEVSGDSEKYGAHWLTGTVVKVIAKTIYLVEYKKPTGDDSHELTREFLDAQYVRPVPPSTNKRFATLEEIEVCYFGVWVRGVISKIVGLKYIVKLRYGKEEEIEFLHSQLRRLRTWVNGQWVCTTKRCGRPLAGKNPDRHLSVSSTLSSTIERKDAVILKRKMSGQDSEGQGEALLPNKELKKGDPTDQLRMEVDLKTPAFDKEANAQDFVNPWRQFVVASLPVSAGLPDAMILTRKMRGQNSEGQGEALLPNKELKKGDPPEQLRMEVDPKTPAFDKEANAQDFVNPWRQFVIASLPVSAGLQDAMILTRKMRGQNSEGPGEALLPKKELSKGDLSDQLRMEVDPTTPAFDKEAHAQDFVNPWRQFSIRSLQVDAGLQEKLLFDGLCVEKKSSKYSSTSEMVATDEERPNSTQSLPKDLNTNHSLSADEIGNITLPTQWENSVGVLGPRFTVTKRRKRLAVRERRRPEVSDVTDVRQHSNVETKKRRGRPPKGSTASINGTISKKPKGTSDRAVECKEGIKGGDPNNRGVSIDVSNDIRSPSHNEEVMPDLLQNVANNTKQVGVVAAQDYSPRMISFAQNGTSASFLTESFQELPKSANAVNDSAIKIKNSSRSSPLKKKGAAARSNPTDSRVEPASRVSSMLDIVGNGNGNGNGRTYHQPVNNDKTDKNHNSNTLPTKWTNAAEMVLTDPAHTASSLVEALPFVKSSSLWRSIESMEVFQIMPQEPHFRALEQQYFKELREGMAIGLMVTFANLEAEVRKVDISDSQAFEEILKALKHLEENGFDVQRLQSRIGEMLEMKNSLEEFQNKKAILEEQVFGREYEKDQIDTEKYVVDKTIREVEQHLSSLLQKRDSLVLQKINDESKIADLQKDMQATQKECHVAEQRFRTLAVSPW